eukprot:13105944-Alexandrium_andersonii.AAC.1
MEGSEGGSGGGHGEPKPPSHPPPPWLQSPFRDVEPPPLPPIPAGLRPIRGPGAPAPFDLWGPGPPPW